MKRLLPTLIILFLSLVLSGCYSAKKEYERGNYDYAIQLAAKKLRKKPNDQKTIDILVNSWEIANTADNDEVSRLMAEQNINWESLYWVYARLDKRQTVVKQLPRLQPSNPLTNVNFEFKDYSAMLSNTKLKAVEDFIAKGDYYMGMGDRFNARSAYTYYNKAYEYDPGYAGLQSKVNQAYNIGLTKILIQLTAQNNVALPENFIQKALDKKWTNLQSGWLNFSTLKQNADYHYFVDALITGVLVSPEKIVETTYTDVKSIEDGWEYAKNPDGSVRLDSLGNKIKVPVYRKISCQVTKYTLTKDAGVNGMILTYSSENSNPLANEPIFGSFAFSYTYGVARGDTRALSKDSENLIKQKVMGFPSNNEMLLNAASNFGNAIYDKVNAYKTYYK